MKKWLLISNLILATLIIVLDFSYALIGELWLKGVTSFGFVLLGGVNLFYFFKTSKEDKKFPIIMLVGLALCMVADVVLNLHFIAGALIFALGHVCYFIAYCTLVNFKWSDLIYSACIFVPVTLFMTLSPMFDFGGVVMMLVCIFYALIISCMVGKALANTIRQSTLTNIIILFGSFLFMFSDIMLLFRVFASADLIFDMLCIATYYPAQIFLAASLFIKTCDEPKAESLEKAE